MKLLKWCFTFADAKSRIESNFIQLMQFMAIVLGCCHALLLFLFWFTKVYPMAIVNIFSILIYVGCYFIAAKGRPLLYFCIVYAEVFVHVLLATLMIGVQAGFTLHLLAMTAIGYLCCYGHVIKFEEDRRFHPFIFCVFSLGLFISLRIHEIDHKPLFSFANKYIPHLFYMTNYFIAMVSLIFSLSMFITQIFSLRERLMNQNSLLEVLSTTDTLTGLSNRRIVMEFVNKAKSSHIPFCAIMSDIDNFKSINDTYGHDCGDKALITVANIFKSCSRKTDVLCRWGGEEILLILPECDLRNAENIAEKIRRTLAGTEVNFKDQILNVTMTFGVAFSEETDSVDAVIHKADTYLYYGKKHGKNCVITSHNMN